MLVQGRLQTNEKSFGDHPRRHFLWRVQQQERCGTKLKSCPSDVVFSYELGIIGQALTNGQAIT